MLRNVHYERAFEDYLRWGGTAYVPVDESRRVLMAGQRIKSFDFLVYPAGSRPWIVDVKGRQFPYYSQDGGSRYWENWVTDDDLAGLAEWQTVFTEQYEARFVFAYWLTGPRDRWPTTSPHVYQNEPYAFFSVGLRDYERLCRRRSPRWSTVGVGGREFQGIIQTMHMGPSRCFTARFRAV